MEKEKPLTKKQQELVAKHYQDAIRIGQSFRSSVLYDDEKENIAVNALFRAVRRFDEDRIHKRNWTAKNGRSLFNTFLYRVVMNSLLSAKRVLDDDGHYKVQKKRISKSNLLYESVIESKTEERGQRENLSTIFSVPDTSSELEAKNLVETIMSKLSPTQREILETFLHPENIPEFYNKKGQPKVRKVTLEVVGKKFGLTRERIRQQLMDIREIANRIKMKQEL